MKPLKTGSLASRRGRTIAIAGASALALLAPFVTVTAAGAAPGTVAGDVTFSGASFAAEIVNDDAAGADGTVSVKSNPMAAGTSAAADPADPDVPTTLAVQVRAQGAGLVTAKANDAWGAGAFTVLIDDVTNAAVDLAAGAATGSDILTAYGVVHANLLGGIAPAAVKDITVVANGDWAGDLKITVSVVERAGAATAAGEGAILRTAGSTTFSTKVVQAADPAFNYTKGSTTELDLFVGLNSDFSANIVKSFGVPADVPEIAALTAVKGVYSITDANGNKFSFDQETGVLSANAADIKTLGDDTLAFSWDVDASTVTVNISVVFKDHARIAEDLSGAVYELVGEEIIQGYNDGTFRPTAPVTRQAFAAFAARYLNANTGNTYETSQYVMCSDDAPSKFKDVPNNAPFCAVIRDMVDAGVTTGYEDGTFKASEPITRRAIAAMLFRLHNLELGLPANSPAAVPTTAPFKDVSVDAPFAAEINWAANTTPDAITNGYEDGTFRPGANSSRQATAAFLSRL